jgi:hypothetical protein
MTRDVLDRLTLFSGSALEVKRLALNMDQVEELKPPENPAKLTDSRARAYIAQFGESSWELDAVEPKELARLVTQAVESLRDPDRWAAQVAKEEAMKAEPQKFADNSRSPEADECPAGAWPATPLRCPALPPGSAR